MSKVYSRDTLARQTRTGLDDELKKAFGILAGAWSVGPLGVLSIVNTLK